jgi:hypothetical protein
MSSEVEICNMALSHLGADPISELVEASNEARECNRVYEMARDFVLEAHPWGWAQKTVLLAELGTPPLGWIYRYGYPSDCLKAILIGLDLKETELPVPFEIRAGDDLNTKVIICDKYQATLQYTAKVTNTEMFSPMFAMALSYYIAFLICESITGSTQRAQSMYRGFLQTSSPSEASDSREAQKLEDRDGRHITARL